MHPHTLHTLRALQVREQLLAVDSTVGSNPLHWAAYSGSSDLAKLLIESANQMLFARSEYAPHPPSPHSSFGGHGRGAWLLDPAAEAW